MKRKSSNYSSPDSGGWMHVADSLFMIRYRGLPCEICGATGGWDGKKMPSCAHHLIFKSRARKFRYDPKNIIVLCPSHHSHYQNTCGPHSITNTQAQAAFADWMKVNKPEQHAWWMENLIESNKVFDRSWTYREMYERLGGEIRKFDKDGDGLPMKDWKPMNHAQAVKRIMEGNRESK